jgi:Cas6b C-terminal domain/Cas6b N-terminal domain
MNQKIMQPTKTTQIARLRLRLERPLRTGEAPAIRGFFGRQFEDQVLMHNHGPNNEVIYQYPKIQYKVLDTHAYMIGINEGAELLSQLWLGIDQTRIGDQELRVLDAQFDWSTAEISIVPQMNDYRFVNPWLALNQKNFEEYSAIHSHALRQEKLARTLVGNTLSLCKSLGIFLTERVKADCSNLRSIKTTLKGQSMIGFIGGFRMNINLPDLLGLGKSVSRGFGTLTPATRN